MTCDLCLLALLKLNKFVTWLPGTQPALNKEALKIAYKHMIPETWQHNLASVGRNPTDKNKTLETLCDFFTENEDLAALARANNNQQQHADRHNTHGNDRVTHRSNTYRKQRDEHNNNKGGAASKSNHGNKKHKIVVSDDKCLIHIGYNHTWGECKINPNNSNANHANKKTKPNGGSKKVKAHSNQTDDTDMKDMDSSEVHATSLEPQNDAGEQPMQMQCIINTTNTLHIFDSLSFEQTSSNKRSEQTLRRQFGPTEREINKQIREAHWY
jgi:hypothetical protein